MNMKQDEVFGTHIEIADVKSAHKFPLFDGQQTVLESEVWDGKETSVALKSVMLEEGSLDAARATMFDSVDSALAETMHEALDVGTAPSSRSEISSEEKLKIRRTTVLPKAILKGKVATLAKDSRERYERLTPLGEGAMGDVALARDNDINRLVALKHLKKQHHVPGTVARFVEEIQTIGQLEHPSIAPIHDVGVDENGQYYFVMKYVQGETIEEIIKKLQAGDRKTHERFPFEVRNQIFQKILQAVQFAHDKGIVHRDLKPANVMVGPHGEVMVMDWGLAKQVDLEVASASPELTDEDATEAGLAPASKQERLFETQHGSLIGTPAYMAPEQALGHNQALDRRSDIYSLGVMYHEWMGLQHYLSHKTNIKDMIWGILQEEPMPLYQLRHQHQPNVAAEFHHFARKAMQKAPEARYQSLAEMSEQLQRAIAGKFDVNCPVTLVKKGGNDTLRMVDAHPVLTIFGIFVGTGLALYGGVSLAIQVIRAVTG